VQPIDLSDVYLDTDVLVNCIFQGLPDSPACLREVRRLLNDGGAIYTSTITRMEYAQTVRRRWMIHWRQELDRYLGELPLFIELPLHSDIIYRSFEHMAEFAMRSHDAVHLATAIHYEIPVFWTCDDHFQRVTGIDVEIVR
jgi:predicted nucleic acid-binding protein